MANHKCSRANNQNFSPKFEVLWIFGQKVKQGFHRFIWKIKKLLIFFYSEAMFDQITLKCRLFEPYASF